jgi:hypothetical protein
MQQSIFPQPRKSRPLHSSIQHHANVLSPSAIHSQPPIPAKSPLLPVHIAPTPMPTPTTCDNDIHPSTPLTQSAPSACPNRPLLRLAICHRACRLPISPAPTSTWRSILLQPRRAHEADDDESFALTAWQGGRRGRWAVGPTKVCSGAGCWVFFFAEMDIRRWEVTWDKDGHGGFWVAQVLELGREERAVCYPCLLG